jgi:hypothetical protein
MIPFKIWGRYTGMSLIFFVFIYNYKKERLISEGTRERYIYSTIKHETVHWKQWKELWFIGFAVLYIYYYLKLRFKKKLSHSKAYRAIPFEREAYYGETIPGYVTNRKKMAWKEYRE